MFEKIEAYLTKKGIEVERIDDEECLTLSFMYKIPALEFPCELGFDKAENYVRLYSELLEFEKEDLDIAYKLANDLNNDAFYLKAYVNEDNVLAAEYYLDTKNLKLKQFRNIVADYKGMNSKIKKLLK